MLATYVAISLVCAKDVYLLLLETAATSDTKICRRRRCRIATTHWQPMLLQSNMVTRMVPLKLYVNHELKGLPSTP